MFNFWSKLKWITDIIRRLVSWFFSEQDSSRIFYSFLVLRSRESLSSCTASTKGVSIKKSYIRVQRTHHTHFYNRWVTSSSHSPSPLICTFVGDLDKTRSWVLFQAYLVTPSPLDVMFNFVNLTVFQLLTFLITYIVALCYHLFTNVTVCMNLGPHSIIFRLRCIGSRISIKNRALPLAIEVNQFT